MFLQVFVNKYLKEKFRRHFRENYVPAVPVIMSFKVLKYFCSGKIVFFYLLACGNKISNRKKCLFSEILAHTTAGFFHKKDDGLWLEFAVFGS